jgi:hypothetical protein
MATSVGGAAAQGLEAGFGMGMRALDAKAREEERKRREQQEAQDRAERFQDREITRQREARAETRDAATSKRQAQQDARQARMDELKVIDDEIGGLTKEGEALWSQYGGYDKVPEEVRGQYSARVREARGRRDKARQSFYQPDVTQQRQQAAETWSRVQSGQLSLDELSDDDLYRTIQIQTQRPLADFLRPKEGGPAPVEQAALDVEAGMQTGNLDLTLKGANVLLAPELRAGIGTEGPDGNEIIKKTLVELVPHPQDPTQFVPVVEVTVRRDDGAIGKYRAPITEGRGLYAKDPRAMPKTLTLDAALDRVGQSATLAAALNRPELRSRLDKATTGKSSADEFLAALGYAGVKSPKKPVAREQVRLGNRVLERTVDKDTGEILSERELKVGPTPRGSGAVNADGDEVGGSGGGSGRTGKTGEELLAALPDADARIVRGLADGSIKPDSISIKGNRRERMLALAKQYKPDANLAGGGNTKIPAPVLKSLQDARETSAAITSLAERFKPGFASKGVLGMGSDASLAAKSVLGLDRESVDWWKDYRKQVELVERHALFGAALTETEKGSWRSADINPGMDDKVIQTNIAKRAELAKKVLEATQQDLIDSGYNAERISSIAGRDVSPPKTAGGAGGSWDGAAPAKPKNKAEFDKLPSGAVFIAPDGSTRRKP